MFEAGQELLLLDEVKHHERHGVPQMLDSRRLIGAGRGVTQDLLGRPVQRDSDGPEAIAMLRWDQRVVLLSEPFVQVVLGYCHA
jgi:hypothetical protein